MRWVWVEGLTRVGGRGQSFVQPVSLCWNYETFETSLYYTDSVYSECFSSVLSEKNSESQWFKSPDRIKQLN